VCVFELCSANNLNFSANVENSLCSLDHWVQGRFEKDQFIPTFISKNISGRKVAVKGRYHWFSSTEANDCLRDKRVWIIGDSYMRLFYFGFMDVLRGNTKNPTQVIDSRKMPEKATTLPYSPKEFEFLREGTMKNSNATIYFVGKRFFSLGRSFASLKQLLPNIINDDLIVMNLLIHDNKRNRVQSSEFKGNMRKAEIFYLSKVWQLSSWLKDQKPRGKFVWSTSNSYKEEKLPSQYKRFQRNKRILRINSRARAYWREAGFPVLDVFHITMACQSKYCTNDGSHHNRMVNRAKAHVLLNYFCQPKKM
jgi:hypothetical protein